MSQTFINRKTLSIISALLLVLLIAFLVFLFVKFNSSASQKLSRYSAVYLKTGDIYFGELSHFPQFGIKNPWFLQKTVDENNQPQIGIAPLVSVFWKPGNKIILNEKEIIFWARLRSDSQIVPMLESGAATQPQP